MADELLWYKFKKNHGNKFGFSLEERNIDSYGDYLFAISMDIYNKLK